jgi:hypothetical protein
MTRCFQRQVQALDGVSSLRPSPTFFRGRGRLDRLSLLALRQAGQPGEGAASVTGSLNQAPKLPSDQRRPHREASGARSTLTVASRCLRSDIASSAPRHLSRGKTRERETMASAKALRTPPPSGEDARRLSPVRHSARVQPSRELRRPPSLAKKSERGDPSFLAPRPKPQAERAALCRSQVRSAA